ncbi:MAG: LON peptidase substrate-binding domain-containing protein, partial [Chloroflexota bacterium]
MRPGETKGRSIEKISLPKELPLLPSGGAVVLPSILIPLGTEDEKAIKLIEEAAAGDKIIGLLAQRPGTLEPTPANLYSIGSAAIIARMFHLPEGIRALLQGLVRIRVKKFTQTTPYLKGEVETLEDELVMSTELEAISRNLLRQFQRVVELAPNLPSELSVVAMNIADPGSLADFVASHINLKVEESQEILESLNVEKRIKKLTSYINRELEVLELGSKIQSRVKEEMTRSQREYFLREQLKAIQQELGEVDERTTELNELKQKIEEAQLPEEAKKEAERELERLAKMSPAAAEYTVARTYLDWLITMPWAKSTTDNIDIQRAAQILDDDHYDLEKVKNRILDYLAVKKLKPDMKGPILCFVGPPGTGKTSVGQSIARALGRNFIRISLGGVRDEADIRGHRRTYVGALPGRIIQALRRAGSNNPVFMMDEVDKLGVDF